MRVLQSWLPSVSVCLSSYYISPEAQVAEQFAHTIRSLMSMLPGSCVGTERKDATDINPRRIMIYVVAREVMLLRRWTVEYILGYWGMPLDVYWVILLTAWLSCTRS